MKNEDQRILALLQEARRQLENDRIRRREPIAIVGMGCRLPGAVSSPESLWELLVNQVDATSEIPPSRWDVDAHYDPDPNAPGKSYVRRGAFLDQIAGFDPMVFGISPREALGMDPQHRLLLEVVWEALENAGIPIDALSGTGTGVWVATCLDDYARRSVTSGDYDRITPYTALGSVRSIAAGRISYVLGLHGPAMHLDTACSSSLVALHLACRSLREGECERAIVGGVNLLLSPESMIGMSKLNALSKDGRCKTFDANADGYGRGEGCGIVILERLSDARAAGRRIDAVIRGTAVNHDGRSNGLTAPNGAAQEAVMRAALADAGVDPERVGYVETHGTGTPLGDPTEVLALNRVYGAGRPASRALHLGTIKTNVGHLEAAAGIAGVIKTALSLSHQRIPALLHFKRPNPRIPWADIPIRVASSEIDWAASPARLAGVSSFGISGTNAHVIMEEPPESAPLEAPPVRSSELVAFAAKTPAALRSQAALLLHHLEAHPEEELSELAFNLIASRSFLECRWAGAVSTRAELARVLSALAGEGGETVEEPRPLPSNPSVAFVFPGQGAQWLGMAKGLLAEEASFREALQACDDAIRVETGWSVILELTAPDHQSRLHRFDVVQPVLFAIQIALVALWKEWGVTPTAVIGHSMGEVAAACVAGALSLADGAAIICRRSALMNRISGQGEMALVELSMVDAQAAISGFEDKVGIAVSNSKRSTVLSGEPHALSQILAALEQRGVFCRRIKVDVASHSPQVDTLLGELVRTLSEIRPAQSSVVMQSTVTGEVIEGHELTPAYWAANLRKPVQFERGIQGLVAQGVSFFVEMSPHPLLVSAVEEVCMDAGVRAVVVGSLRREQPERATMLGALAQLFKGGHHLDAQRLFPKGRRLIRLPNYPWQRDRFWLDPPKPSRGGVAAEHPILGTAIASPLADLTFELSLGLASAPWLADHRFAGKVVVPGAALAELLRMAGDERDSGAACELRDLVFREPLVIPEKSDRWLQITLTDGGKRGAVYSRAAGDNLDAGWTLHATCGLESLRGYDAQRFDVKQRRAELPRIIDVAALYAACSAAGLEYGPAFRGLRSLSAGPGELLAEARLGVELERSNFGLHPALLDAALQSCFALGETRGAALPFAVARYALHQTGAQAVFAHGRLTEAPTAEGMVLDLLLTDADGAPVSSIEGLHLRPADAQAFGAATRSRVATFYELAWQAMPSPTRGGSLAGAWAVLGGSLEEASARQLVSSLRQLGADARCVEIGELQTQRCDHVVCVWREAQSPEAAMRAAVDCLSVVQAVRQHERSPRLWLVTRGAVMADSAAHAAISGATVWGFGRTLMQEHPEFRCTLIDLDGSVPFDAVADAIGNELANAAGEPQIAIRDGARYVARLVRARRTAVRRLEAQNYRLRVEHEGLLESIGLQDEERRDPGRGEVELEVSASGMNFRDVLGAMGMYPGGLRALGSECAGFVTRLGPGTSGLKVGDMVMAMSPGAFSRYVTVDSRLVIRFPSHLSLVEAATIPVAFLTAWYALHDLAHVQPGETVLVHAAAGGVGMAALQLARHMGAKVIATASPSKWKLVEALGASRVASSRDPGFAREFAERSERVDVVLNSLKGEFIDASLSLLSSGGRFIEMGKTDLREKAQVGRRFPGVVYRPFDLEEAGSARLGELFASIGRGLASRELRALPTTTYPISDAERAFRLMAQGRHVGKLALLASPAGVRSGGAVLITGGLGAIGAEMAKALARRGVSHLVLMGRRGLETPGATELVGQLEDLGALVDVVAGDISVHADAAKAVAVASSRTSLSGIVHAAGFIDDGLLGDQTPERLTRVLAPKVLGAWHLHELTRERHLDFFVMYSSIAGTLGSPGQAGYAAANAYLDALASYRRARGLPGQSLAWGPWGEAGLAAELGAAQKSRLARLGFDSIDAAVGVELFEEALGRSEAQLAPLALDLRKVKKSFLGPVPPVWQSLVQPALIASSAPSVNVEADVRSLAAEKRLPHIVKAVRSEVARILSLSSDVMVQPDLPLKAMGVDSLMAVELRNALGRRFSLALPATLVFNHPTSEAIARHVLSLLQEDRSVSSSGAVAVAHGECVKKLDVPNARLFGFHDAGGSAALFAPFAELDRDGIEVHTISHTRGQAPDGGRRYLSDAVSYIRRSSDRPVVLFGHSLGGLFAWRVAKALAEQQAPTPALLVVSACVLPAQNERSVSEVDLSELFDTVLGARASASESLRKEFEADFQLWSEFPSVDPQPLGAPIFAIAGAGDQVADERAMQEWRLRTLGSFSMTTVPGGHFYLNDEAARRVMLEQLRAVIRRAVGR